MPSDIINTHRTGPIYRAHRTGPIYRAHQPHRSK
jgi:hypothetical protein